MSRLGRLWTAVETVVSAASILGRTPAKRSSRRTCLDVEDGTDAVALVRRLTGTRSDASELADRLDRLYRRFPPNEAMMRRLSMLQQRVRGRGDEEEFCVVTIFIVASLVLGRDPHPKPLSVTSSPPVQTRTRPVLPASRSFS